MKRFIYALLLVLSVGLFSSCNKEGGAGSSSLIGTWDLVEDGYELNGNYVKVPITDLCYWEFTKTTLTTHDSSDMLNGVPVEYTYSNGTITMMGIQFYKVLSLTKTELKIRCIVQNGDGSYSVSTFKKR